MTAQHPIDGSDWDILANEDTRTAEQKLADRIKGQIERLQFVEANLRGDRAVADWMVDMFDAPTVESLRGDLRNIAWEINRLASK